MRRTVTKAPTAMTGPRAKGATAALAGAGAEGEATTRDMGPLDAPSPSGRTPAGTVLGPHERSVTGRFHHQPPGPRPAQHLAAHDTAHDRKSLIRWVSCSPGHGSGLRLRPSPRPRKNITRHDTPAEHSALALPPPTAPACPPARRVHRGCAGNPRPGLPRVRSAIERAVHTREGTGKKRALNGCTSVATATTAVHATSQNVTDIQLCIAALAGFPMRTVVPIGGIQSVT